MPPKKNDDQLLTLPQFKAITILPVFALPVKRTEQLTNWLINRKLTVQRNLSIERAVDILKERGLYTEPKKDPKDVKATEGVPAADRTAEVERLLKEVGADLIIKNYSTIHGEVVVQARRDKKDKLEGKDTSAPKKEAKKQGKKDGKKDSKVEQPPPVIEQPKVTEKTYRMDGDGFVVLLDVPRTAEDIDKILDSNQGSLPADIILLIEEKTMWDWKEPDLELLNQQPKEVDELKKLMESPVRAVSSEATRNKPPSAEDAAAIKRGKDLYAQILAKRSISTLSAMKRMCTRQLKYEYNPYKAAESAPLFIEKMFTLTGELSLDRSSYDEWIKQASISPMIKPIQIVERVAVEEKPDDSKAKKDGKKEAKKQQKPPEFIQKIKLIRYESQPENIKSDLRQLKVTNRIKPPQDISSLLDNLLESIERDHRTHSKEYQERVGSAPEQPSQQQIEQLFSQQRLLLQSPKRLSTAGDILELKLSTNWDSSLYLRSSHLPTGAKYASKAFGPKLSTLSCVSKLPTNRLFRYYILSKFESLLKELKPYRSWNLLNRTYQESYSRDNLQRTINKQLQSEPQVIACQLPQDDLKLVLLLHENPPGRVLYHNTMLPWRAMPSLDNWIKYFKGNQDNLKTKLFYDYLEEEVGGVGTYQKIMMPSDNCPIKEIVDCVGSSKIVRHQVIKQTCRFGIRSSSQQPEFWAVIKDLLSMTVMTEEIQQVNVSDPPKEGSVPSQEAIAHPEEIKSHAQKTLWLRGDKVMYKFWPYATFFSLDPQSSESKRTVGSKGEVIRYFRDRSVWIGYPNGDTAWYRGGNWLRIVNDKRQRKDAPAEALKVETLMEGDRRIHVREDQTVLIIHGALTTVVFKDGTTIVTDSKQYTTTTYKVGFPTVRIRLQPHKFKDQNVIGQGSAYALLGHDNLFERSCDGYIYEVFAPELSYYLYHEKVDVNGVAEAAAVQLISLEEGSLMKLSQNNIIYIANQDRKRLDQLDAVESWLQLFTTRENWKEGAYHIDLSQGSFQTHDSEGNHFKLYLDRPSETKIAVSLNINGSSNGQQPTFGNGYHVVSQNFFLPTPKNFMEPSLFVIRKDGSGLQFFTEEQLGNFTQRAQTEGYELHKETLDEETTHLLYSRKHSTQAVAAVEKFSKPLSTAPELPRCLHANPPTFLCKPHPNPEQVCLRSFLQSTPLTDYTAYTTLLEEYATQQKHLRHRLKTQYNILTREQLLS